MPSTTLLGVVVVVVVVVLVVVVVEGDDVLGVGADVVVLVVGGPCSWITPARGGRGAFVVVVGRVSVDFEAAAFAAV